MSGDDAFLKPTETSGARYADLYEKLNKHQALLALPPEFVGGGESEVPKLMDVTRAELRAMTHEEVAEASVLVQIASFAVQRWQDRCLAVAHWASEAITHMIADEMGTLHSFAFKDRRAAAIKNNPMASKLNALKVQAEALSKDVDYLAARLEHTARVYENLSRVKLKQHG